MNKPLVSVIIPLLNREEQLANSIDNFLSQAQSIDSVLSQDYPFIELLLIINGSDDGVTDWLNEGQKQDSRLNYLSLPGKETTALIDHALNQARGTIIGCLTPGDYYAPGAVSRAIENLLANPDWLMVYGHSKYFDISGNLIDSFSTQSPEIPNIASVNGHLFCEASVFFKRSLYVLLGGMEKANRLSFSFDYWQKVFVKFPSRIGFIDAIQAYSRIDNETTTFREKTGSGSIESKTVTSPMPPVSDTEKVSRINPNDLISRHSLPEHIQFADDYFLSLENDFFLYQKPFFHPQDCAPSLSNLGQLFAGANLEKGMKVIDFASGSCWLSRILVQLGCIVTCCDISETALNIGKELFRKYPPISDDFSIPDFHVFDGVHLDFPDKTFDRILVNDSFHHIPNTSVVLAEFFRVLKDDGIVCMSEPGRFHSQTETSQHEMKEFHVIENDLILEDLWKDAETIGFESIQICPVLRQSYLSIENYLRCIRGEISEKVLHSLIRDTVNHSIFFLHKCALTDLYQIITEREKFDEAWYLARHPDVDAAVNAGAFDSGWNHYQNHGAAEGRVARKLPLQ